MDPLQNPSNPYYLHPGENLGMVLVHLCLMAATITCGAEE